MSRIVKHRTFDKFDGGMLKPANIHSNVYVSAKKDRFHYDTFFAWNDETGYGYRAGLNKKMSNATGYVITIDGSYVGKSNGD